MPRHGYPSTVSYSFGPGPITPAVKWIIGANVAFFLASLEDFQGMNWVYAERVGETPPARSTVEVAALPSGALVEIEAIALA